MKPGIKVRILVEGAFKDKLGVVRSYPHKYRNSNTILVILEAGTAACFKPDEDLWKLGPLLFARVSS